MPDSAAPPYYDPLDPAFLAAPWGFYRWLRDEQPVWRDPASGAYLISRFADVWEIAADWEAFSSEPEAGSRQHFASMDPPQHDRHRRKVARAFMPRAIGRLRADVQARCAALLEPLASSAGFDAITGFTELLPGLTVSAIVGVPTVLDEEFRERALLLAETAATPAYDAAMTALEDTARRIVDATHPPQPGGIAAGLLADRDDPLDVAEMVGLVTNLVLAGTDTVTHLLGSAIMLLDERPGLRDHLLAQPALIPVAVEEILRLESPVQLLLRRTTRDVTLHGVTIPAQGQVRLLWGAANRDEREFPGPDSFRLDRDAIRHLAFGHGLHFCLGAALARLEAEAAITALLPVLTRVRVRTDEVQRLPSIVFRGFRRLLLERVHQPGP